MTSIALPEAILRGNLVEQIAYLDSHPEEVARLPRDAQRAMLAVRIMGQGKYLLPPSYPGGFSGVIVARMERAADDGPFHVEGRRPTVCGRCREFCWLSPMSPRRILCLCIDCVIDLGTREAVDQWQREQAP